MARPRRAIMVSIALAVACLVVGCSGVSTPNAGQPASAGPRLPDHRGTVFAEAWNGETRQLGIALNDPHSLQWSQMSEAAVKVAHGLVSAVSPDGESQWPWFPYRKFLAFQAGEVAAGRPPLLLTATYEGRSRPVYWNWSLGFPQPGESPTVSDPNAWEQAVDVGDDRYVAWVLANYVRPVMLHRYFAADEQRIDLPGPYPNEWLGVDEIAINFHLLGVLDDAGHWVPLDQGPVVDAPFPASSAALHSAFRHFFSQLHRDAPGIRVLANMGSPDDWTRFRADFADVDGLLNEDLFTYARTDPSNEHRALLLSTWRALSTYSASGRVVLLGSVLQPQSPTYRTDLRSDLMAYLLLSGPESAWAPKSTASKEIPPPDYQAMASAIGPATSPMSVRTEGTSGAALYQRATRNGIVYVNESGHDVTVSCPAGATCRDRTGARVRHLTVPDLTGDYLLISR